MQTRAKGPAAGWHWLANAINLGRHNPRALFGAAALLMLVALVPSVIQVVAAQLLGPERIEANLWIIGATTLAMMVVFPLLIGGFLRVIDAAENGRPTRATALFDPFRAGQGGGRLIGIGLLLLLVYLALLGLVLGVFGREVVAWYIDVFADMQAAPAGTPPDMPPLPEGVGTVAGLSLLVMMLASGLYAIGFGQVALGGRSVGGAIADAFAGTFKNVLPLLVLTVCALVAMLVAALAIMLVVALLVLVGGLVHPMVGAALAVPVYVAFLVMMYVVMFGVLYFIWRDVCGPTAAAAPGAGFHVEA